MKPEQILDELKRRFKDGAFCLMFIDQIDRPVTLADIERIIYDVYKQSITEKG